MKKQAGQPSPQTAIRVYCLGHFRVEIDGSPLPESAQAQRKPLALLKTLIALGGADVPEDQLTEALWPDADGDAASQSFRTALYRLRLALGSEAVRIHQGRVSIGAAISCDALELVPLLAGVERATDSGDTGSIAEPLDGAIALYRAPFLEGEYDPPEILVARDRLHGRFLRALRESAVLLERNGERDAAIRLYQKGAEADPVAEELVQPLMRLLHREGRASEAEAAYQRLRRGLEAQGGVAPSAETEALRKTPMGRSSSAEPPGKSESSGLGIDTIPLPEKPSIAVLPLTNMSGDPTLDYFSDGLAEDLITDLSQYAQLAVVARNSTFQYKGRAVDVRDVGRELGVRYVLEGSVRASEEKDRVRITFQLADAATGAHIWAERYDRELKNVFALQEEIVDQVCLAVDAQLIEGGQAVGRRGSTKNYEAYKLFRKGNEIYHRLTRESLAESIGYFKKALRIDPNFATAWSNIGWTHTILWVWNWSKEPDDELQRAERMALKALSLNPSHPEFLMQVAYIRACQGNYGEAICLGRQALAGDPTAADNRTIWAWILAISGDYVQALSQAKQGIRLTHSPRGDMYQACGFCLLALGRRSESIPYLEMAVRLHPSIATSATSLITALVEIGRWDSAKIFAKKILEADPGFVSHAFPLRKPYVDQTMPARILAAWNAIEFKIGGH